jgi:hypothetical protein
VLPDDWIERLFRRFEDFYGAKWAAQFGDFPRDRVKRTWAEELGGFADKPEAIGRALDAQKTSPYPPTLPEFLALCRDAAKRISTDKPALPYKPTAEDVERQREMSKRLGDVIGAGKMRDGIDAHWATHPRNAVQLGMIFDAAKRDARFQPCIAQMVADGICTAEGQLLKAYLGMNSWESVRRAA